MSSVRGAAVVVVGALSAALLIAGCSSSGGPRASEAPTTTFTTTTNKTADTPTTVASSSTPGSTAAPSAQPQKYEASLPIPIQEAAAAVVGDRMYVVGGYDASRNSSRSVFELHGGAWVTGPSLPIAVNHPGVAAIGNDVYVAGGFTPDGATNRAFVLAAGSSSWHELAPLHQARGALALLALDGRLYAIGGRDVGVQVAQPERYDPSSGTWTDLPAMPSPRNHVAGYVDGSLVCVAGGRTPDTSSAVDCFDPATNAWARRATLPTGTSGAAAVVMNGVTLVAGGEPAGETSIVGVVQELRQGTWTSTPMLVPRHGTADAIYQGRLWLCGGATTPGFQAVATCTSIVP